MNATPKPTHDDAIPINRPAAGALAHIRYSGLPMLTGGDFCLREFGVADARDLANLVNGETVGHLTQPPPTSTVDGVRFVRRLLADRSAGLSLCYAVTRERAAGIAGLILVRRLELDFRIAECQFLFEKSAWSSGLSLSSLTYAMDFAFRDIGLHRLECRSLTRDEGNILRSAGFVAEGLLRMPSDLDSTFEDQTVWSVLRSEWELDSARAPRREAATHQPDDTPTADITSHEPEPLPTWTAELPVLSGPRVTLREIDHADGEALLRELEPAEIEVCIEPPPTTVEIFHQYIAWVRRQRARGRAICFSIFVDGNPDAVGLLQVRSLGRRFAVAEWGAGLTRRYRGNGIFGEVMSLVGPFVFDTLGVRRLEARTSGGNAGAIASLERLGAVKEACLRQSFLKHGEYLDDELWAVTDVDWRRGQPRPVQRGV